jgi:hypothetical protein
VQPNQSFGTKRFTNCLQCHRESEQRQKRIVPFIPAEFATCPRLPSNFPIPETRPCKCRKFVPADPAPMAHRLATYRRLSASGLKGGVLLSCGGGRTGYWVCCTFVSGCSISTTLISVLWVVLVFKGVADLAETWRYLPRPIWICDTPGRGISAACKLIVPVRMAAL